ncbi:MAG: hypothetical protein KDA90_11120 [Planctomycetaceae bacterium]|nr:hypothetical protein [Planctomycetaceae bacterium]
MAKKRAARGDMNMSAEIREYLQANPDATGRDCFEMLQEKHPTATINEASCSVAFSNMRRKLGLRKSGRKTVVRKRRPAAVVSASRSKASGGFSLDALQTACDLIAKSGSADAAIQILESLKGLKAS